VKCSIDLLFFFRLSLKTLRSFSASKINVVFLFDETSIKSELEVDQHLPTTSSTVFKDVEGDDEIGSTTSRETTNNFTATIETCIACCTSVLKDCQLAGFATVHLASSKWTALVADPFRVAGLLGIHAIDGKLENIFPHQLFSKPIINTQNYVVLMNKMIQNGKISIGISMFLCNYCSFIVELSGSMFCTLPVFMDRDFAFPSVILKVFMIDIISIFLL
jgi:hypothetical protein